MLFSRRLPLSSLVVCLAGLLVRDCSCSSHDVDISNGVGRRFDGIGGLSGGGATSKLLVNYAEPLRSQILDYLFKPNFGASLHILKVEIGGDAQSTDGTESSHMHEPWSERYDRGYEWWLMVEAKKRNPAIKLYGLPWAFPGWLGKKDPYGNATATATYVVKWIQGAKMYYGLDIDYVGIWNERPYNKNYIMVLRALLNKNSLEHVQIVASDMKWSIVPDIIKDKTFADTVDYIGVHYPGCISPQSAMDTNKTLWASEDYSTFNDAVGAGCWARLLNQNYVVGYMTSTIAWNLVASYYQALRDGRDSLMTAQEPWSGHYAVELPIWVTAHTTQFTSIGWYYLQHGAGVGKLPNGGSYVTLTDPSQEQLTMVIETMSHNHSICIRPYLPPYETKPQDVTFNLKGKLASLNTLYMWKSVLRYDGQPSEMFKYLGPVKLTAGSFSLHLEVDVVITLTTVERDQPHLYPPPPPSRPFPLPYEDDYEVYPTNTEAYNFAPQIGVWEVHKSSSLNHGKVNRQVVLREPCIWCLTGARPINVGGNFNWSDIHMNVDIFIPHINGTKGVFVAGRVEHVSCKEKPTGVFFFIEVGRQNYTLTQNLAGSDILETGTLPKMIEYNTWYTLSLDIQRSQMWGSLDGVPVFAKVEIPATIQHGFVAYGSSGFGISDYDNLYVSAPSAAPRGKISQGRNEINVDILE